MFKSLASLVLLCLITPAADGLAARPTPAPRPQTVVAPESFLTSEQRFIKLVSELFAKSHVAERLAVLEMDYTAYADSYMHSVTTKRACAVASPLGSSCLAILDAPAPTTPPLFARVAEFHRQTALYDQQIADLISKKTQSADKAEQRVYQDLITELSKRKLAFHKANHSAQRLVRYLEVVRLPKAHIPHFLNLMTTVELDLRRAKTARAS